MPTYVIFLKDGCAPTVKYTHKDTVAREAMRLRSVTNANVYIAEVVAEVVFTGRGENWVNWDGGMNVDLPLSPETKKKLLDKLQVLEEKLRENNRRVNELELQKATIREELYALREEVQKCS